MDWSTVPAGAYLGGFAVAMAIAGFIWLYIDRGKT